MSRRSRLLGCFLCLLLEPGCCSDNKPQPVTEAVTPAPFQQFIATNFDWSTVKRVALMPLANQSNFEHASEELQTNLAAELQRMGRFDVVVVPLEDPAARARDVFQRGAFDELELLRIARVHDAQAVMFGMVTQYHPYAPPRVGLSLVMISPGEGVAIASADGLWDARELSTARQAQAYLQEKTSWRQGLLGMDRAFESPDVYQRFVCQQIATSMNPPEAGFPSPGSPATPTPIYSFPVDVMPAGYRADPANPHRPQIPAEQGNPDNR